MKNHNIDVWGCIQTEGDDKWRKIEKNGKMITNQKWIYIFAYIYTQLPHFNERERMILCDCMPIIPTFSLSLSISPNSSYTAEHFFSIIIFTFTTIFFLLFSRSFGHRVNHMPMWLKWLFLYLTNRSTVIISNLKSEEESSTQQRYTRSMWKLISVRKYFQKRAFHSNSILNESLSFRISLRIEKKKRFL